jgi:esterase/lipase superfamily enzyme
MSKVYFATNRDANRKRDPDDFGTAFNPDSVDSLRFGTATVDGAGGLQVHVVPERLRAEAGKSRLGSRTVFEELRAGMQAGADVVVFVHGYNVSFRGALATAARIRGTFGGGARRVEVAAFSWPSDGSLKPFLAYRRDRTDAATSGPALARALLKLAEFLHEVRRGEECGGRIHLMAHSMGNYVLRHAVQELRRHGGGELPRIFDQVLLLAADEDYDALEHDHKLQLLPTLASGVNVYFNRGDTALVISDRTKRNPTRLGSQGPRSPLNVPGSVTLVDTSEVVGGLIEHDYFLSDAVTVRDIARVLAGEGAHSIRGRRYVPSQNRYVLTREDGEPSGQ